MNRRESKSRVSGSFFLPRWRVDPGSRWQLLRLWHAVFEAVRCALESVCQRGLSLLANFDGAAGMNALGRHHPDTGMAVLPVVPNEELDAVRARVGERAKACREAWLVFHGFELCLRVRVVVGDVGPAVRLGDAQVAQQSGHWLGAHAAATVGMQGQRARRYAFLGGAVGNKLLGQLGGFLLGHHPADDVAAEDVEDDIQMEAGAPDRPLQFRDVPTPDLIGHYGQQFRFGVLGMAQLVATLAHGGTALQQAVHGAHRGHVAPLVEQLGVDGRRRAIGETRAVEHVERDAALQFRQSQRRSPHRRRSGRQWAAVARASVAIQGAAWQAQGAAGGGHADLSSEAVGGADHFGSLGVSAVLSPSRVESFFGRR